MKRLFLVLAFVAAVPTATSSKNKEPEPNFDAVLRVSGRFSIGHACPIASNLVLTSAHIVDPRPFDRGASLVNLRFQSVKGDTKGTLVPFLTRSEMDVSPVEPSVPVAFYPVAAKDPEKGDMLYFLGYDYRKPSVAFSPRTYSGPVVNVLAGMIVVDVEGVQGASGGCALNEAGEVVGIVSSLLGLDNGDSITIFDSVSGNWIDRLKALVAEMRATEEK